ncbi:MAG: hypothetical protein HWN66_12595 [Candidatus Helarchaeota archaeon]|nr:hypothetical protein [Candidatus Helarchaeota archaeon]
MGTSSSRNAPKGGDWTKAKRSVSNYVRQRGRGGVTPRNLIGNFVRALGGAREAVSGTGRAGGKSTFFPAVSVGQKLGAFLVGVAKDGLDQTFSKWGLADLIGKNPYEVVSHLVDALAGAGGPLDEAVARAALTETLANIFDENNEEYIQLREDWDSRINEVEILEILKIFLIEVIYRRFLSDLAERIQSKAISSDDAFERESEIRGFIEEMIKFTLVIHDPLNIDWRGAEGRDLITQNMEAVLAQAEV